MFEITFGMALDGARWMNEPASIAMAPEPTNASGAVRLPMAQAVSIARPGGMRSEIV